MQVTIKRCTSEQINWDVAVQSDENTDEVFEACKNISEDIEAIMEKDKEISTITIEYDL